MAAALAACLGTLVVVLACGTLFAALGQRILRLTRVFLSADSEDLLLSIAVGVIALQVTLFFAQLFPDIRLAVALCFALALLAGAKDFAPIFRKASQILRRILAGSPLECFLATTTVAVLFVEAVASMAPLTGSDALHYHFTAPRLILEHGFHPNFFLSQSFFCGQSHLLILAGLALGSEKLAMGLIFLGGSLAAAAAACLGRRWMSREWAWLVALVFLLTPLVFWQISASGCPDIWMVFFSTLAVLVIAQVGNLPYAWGSVIAGTLAGGIAGVKYVGCVLAAVIAVAFVFQVRRLFATFLFMTGALFAGVWPYVRNFNWTGDPIFPFFVRYLALARLNAYTLTAYIQDTNAHGTIHPLILLKGVLFAGFQGPASGLWEFYGPLVLALAPLLILAVRRTPLWRTVLIVWIGGAVAIQLWTGMMRYLLPLLAIALAAVFAGIAQLRSRGWRMSMSFSVGSVGFFLLLSSAGLILYNRAALLAATGLVSSEDYLRRRAPDYEIAQFINTALGGSKPRDKTLVFIRHAYYLRVPFVFGDPRMSWAVNPDRLQLTDAWRHFFREHGIRWVVRSPDYPPAISAQLLELERKGQLVPIAQSEVSTFQGMRVYGVREKIPVVILEVK